MKEQFYNYISSRIEKEKSVKTEWRKENTEIIFHKNADSGYDIVLGFDGDALYLQTDRGYHDHFHIDMFKNFDKALESVMGLVRDLLSRNMRITEILSNNRSRKWLLQCFRDGQWKTESSSGLLIWNYLGKKTEKYYYNDILLPRQM